MFDGVAKHYDRTNAVLSAGNAYLWRIATVRAVAPQPGERILDLAAGTGTSSVALAHTGAKVIAVDFSAGMIEEGRRKHKNIEFVQADIEKLPFGDDEFDAVTISFGIRNVNDPKQALAEMYRVLKAAASSSASSLNPRARFSEWDIRPTSGTSCPPFRLRFRRIRRPTPTWPTPSRTGRTRDNSASGFAAPASCALPTAT
jgi:ubiquinone/menaquinone biosynthesis C-methylase UbiE